MNALVKAESTALSTMSEAELLTVLGSSLYPGAAPASIKLVLGYCKAAGLDPMQKPVHIVPMWDSKAGQMRDVVMPGVGLYRTQASRTGRFAGQTEPEFGPMVTEKLGGQEITFPEWARVTVKKQMDNGEVAEFTAKEFWIENYAVKGGKEKSVAPNAMWTKRPRGQIGKCAAAQALRLAFPEMGAQPTAEEMEGKTMGPDEMPPSFDYLDPAPFIKAVAGLNTDADAAKYWKDNNAKFAKQPVDYQAFKDAVIARRTALKDAKPADTDEKPAATAASASAPDTGEIVMTYAKVLDMMLAAAAKKSTDAMDVAQDWVSAVPDKAQQDELNAKCEALRMEMAVAP